jgi:hypothetical protein
MRLRPVARNQPLRPPRIQSSKIVESRAAGLDSKRSVLIGICPDAFAAARNSAARRRLGITSASNSEHWSEKSSPSSSWTYVERIVMCSGFRDSLLFWRLMLSRST